MKSFFFALTLVYGLASMAKQATIIVETGAKCPTGYEKTLNAYKYIKGTGWVKIGEQCELIKNGNERNRD